MDVPYGIPEPPLPAKGGGCFSWRNGEFSSSPFRGWAEKERRERKRDLMALSGRLAKVSLSEERGEGGRRERDTDQSLIPNPPSPLQLFH